MDHIFLDKGTMNIHSPTTQKYLLVASLLIVVMNLDFGTSVRVKALEPSNRSLISWRDVVTDNER